jgi:glycosyltransferase involved in cell wall biosynthesis
MKLLYYSPHPHLSESASTGYGTHMREMIAAFRTMGIEVKTVIAGDLNTENKTSGTTSAQSKNQIKRLLPSLLWETLKDVQLIRFDNTMQQKLAEAIELFRPDVVYERIAYLQPSGVRACAKAGVRHIAEINAPFPEERVAFSGRSLMLGAARRAEREIIESTMAISVVSSALASYIEKQVCGASTKTVVIPNCVNPADQKFNITEAENLKSNLGLRELPVVGFVGSVFPYHGVDILIDAFARLEVEARLLIVGDGASIPELKQRAIDAGIQHKVIFTGSIPHSEVYAYMELMDICCMAKSNWYGSPVKIFEYGLAGKAVIAPDLSPIHDVMDQQTAMIVKPDVPGVYAALNTLINNKAMRDEIAGAWHQRVLERHTWAAAAKTIADLCV